jgi:hypothetical protein
MISLEDEFVAIQLLRRQMREKIAPLKEQMDELEIQMRLVMDPYVAEIQEREDTIRMAVLERGESFKCDAGKATHRKAYPRYSWDNKALEGFAAAGHEEILQFRKESMVQASVSIKLVEVDE